MHSQGTENLGVLMGEEWKNLNNAVVCVPTPSQTLTLLNTILFLSTYLDVGGIWGWRC